MLCLGARRFRDPSDWCARTFFHITSFYVVISTSSPLTPKTLLHKYQDTAGKALFTLHHKFFVIAVNKHNLFILYTFGVIMCPTVFTNADQSSTNLTVVNLISKSIQPEYWTVLSCFAFNLLFWLPIDMTEGHDSCGAWSRTAAFVGGFYAQSERPFVLRDGQNVRVIIPTSPRKVCSRVWSQEEHVSLHSGRTLRSCLLLENSCVSCAAYLELLIWPETQTRLMKWVKTAEGVYICTIACILQRKKPLRSFLSCPAGLGVLLSNGVSKFVPFSVYVQKNMKKCLHRITTSLIVPQLIFIPTKTNVWQDEKEPSLSLFSDHLWEAIKDLVCSWAHLFCGAQGKNSS